MIIGPSERFYRHRLAHGELLTSYLTVEESDLMIMSSAALDIARLEDSLRLVRAELKSYGAQNPSFFDSLVPIEAHSDAPLLVRQMCEAGRVCNVGPMAAVAGATAQRLGREMAHLDEVIIENGGDIYMRGKVERRVLVYAGPSPLSGRVSVVLPAGEYGVCTSAGSFGHSFSFGKADAAMVVARDACLADAAATALGNLVKTAADLEQAVTNLAALPGVIGALAIMGDKIGIAGELTIAGAKEVPYALSETTF